MCPMFNGPKEEKEKKKKKEATKNLLFFFLSRLSCSVNNERSFLVLFLSSYVLTQRE
jgi:hypothetical protein